MRLACPPGSSIPHVNTNVADAQDSLSDATFQRWSNFINVFRYSCTCFFVPWKHTRRQNRTSARHSVSERAWNIGMW